MTDMLTPAEAQGLPEVPPVFPVETTVTAPEPLAVLHGLIDEARLAIAQDASSPLFMFILAWDQMLGTAMAKTQEIADTLKPKGGLPVAEVRKLIAESDDPQVVERRELLAKLDAKRKEVLGQMHTLVGAGTPEIDGEEKAALKEEYKVHRDLLSKTVPSLEAMFSLQNSAEGIVLAKALSAAIPSLTGSSGGGSGTKRTRFESVSALTPEGVKDFGTFSALSQAKGVKELVPAIYALYEASTDNTFSLSNGWQISVTPKSQD